MPLSIALRPAHVWWHSIWVKRVYLRTVDLVASGLVDVRSLIKDVAHTVGIAPEGMAKLHRRYTHIYGQ